MINTAVNELEQSRQFYEEILGVEFAEERHGDGPVHLNMTFGQWNTPSWVLVSLWPDSDRAGTADIGFLVMGPVRLDGNPKQEVTSLVLAPGTASQHLRRTCC